VALRGWALRSCLWSNHRVGSWRRLRGSAFLTRDVIQIVPGLRDGGVADHARTLAVGLRERGIKSRFLVAADGDGDAVGADTERLPSRTADALVAALHALGDAPVVLHYSNYGYATRGCPRWLVGGLEAWRRNGGPQLITVFHELFATGRPWESSFWLSPVQRRLAARMSRASTGLVTSLDHYGARLRAWSPDAPVAVLPVFSTTGEAPLPSPLPERNPTLVVFGSEGVRRRAYRLATAEIGVACRQLGIGAILDVGAGDAAPERVGVVPVSQLGFLPAEQVGALLGRSLAGFAAYPRAYLGKSTVFASYCAHRLVPVCSWPGETADGAPEFLWHPSGPVPASWQAVADRAYAWYGEHSLARHVAGYGALLQ
jgi:hypothetical protein